MTPLSALQPQAGRLPTGPAGFRKLAAAATISGLGDGVTQVAGVLLAVSLTRSPLRLAGLLAAQQLPWVLGALPAGVLVDRADRRRVLAAACLVRAAAVGVLGVLTAAGRAGMPLLYLVLALAGAAGVVYENATTAVLPTLVGPAGRPRANGRLQAASSLSRSLVAQPVGAWLFTVAPWMPFLLDTVALLLVTLLTATLPGARRPRTGLPGASPPSRTTGRPSILEGLGWLRRHRILRTLALTASLSNLGLGALFSVFVLFARVRLGASPFGYGLVLAVMAAGGLAGGLIAGRVTAALGAGAALRAELAVETLTYPGLLVTRNPVAAAALLAVLSANLTVFSSLGASLRQSLAPDGLLGRVQGAYRAVSNGGLLAGATLGGLLTSACGLTAPLWLGLAATTAAITLAWRPFATLHTVGATP
jgi:predicted MFS family arabinose efflux permease